MNVKLLTIITPIYNRGKLLLLLFDSLVNQKQYNFKWHIIDDGSEEDIQSIVENLKADAPFDIIFTRKENGGKHTALNLAFSMLDTELEMIVDSDDILLPDATEQIAKEWEKKRNSNVAGIIFLKGYKDGSLVGDSTLKDGIYNMIDVMFKYRIGGDKEEVFRCDIIKNYRFPEYAGERYVGEDYIWRQIYLKHKMAYVNKIIYHCEYLEDGLTKRGRLLRIRCPYGGMANSKVSFDKQFPVKERFKRGMLYVCYGRFAKMSLKEIIVSGGNKGLLMISCIPGMLLHIYWNRKYMGEELCE